MVKTPMQQDPQPQTNAFIALNLPYAVGIQLAAAARMLQFGLHDIASLQSEGEHHITLRYIGSSSTQQLQTLLDRHSTRHGPQLAPFQLHLDGISAFPDLDAPQIIWAAIGGDIDVLRKVQAQIDEIATELGMPPTDFPFNPHITIGHMEKRPLSEQQATKVRNVVAALRSDPPFYPPHHAWTVDTLSAMSSARTRSDVKYQTVVQTRLGTC